MHTLASDASEGVDPLGGLVEGSDHYFYGATQAGEFSGTTQTGDAFKFNASGD